MENAALKNRSFHDDIVMRMIFVGMNELINTFVNRFANPELPYLFFAMAIVPTLFLIYIYSTIEQTAFVQDVREICIYDLLIKIIAISTFIFAHDTLYQDFKPIRAIGVKIIYLVLWLRIFWPCKQQTPEDYQNWPIFGLLALWQTRHKKSWQVCPATGWQPLAAYGGIAASFVAGYCFWRYNISNVEVVNSIGQFAILIFIVRTAPPRAKRWWQDHLARIEADRIAKETAERAASEARQIIMQQAQQSVEFEAARYAAEHHAKAAQDEAAQLRDQLANPPQAEPPPPHPVLAMLDRNSPTFDAGLYLTMLARHERIKHTGKTKEKAKQDIFDTLAPIAVELGVTPKWRTKQDQPNRTILDSCIMAGLVGFGDED